MCDFIKISILNKILCCIFLLLYLLTACNSIKKEQSISKKDTPFSAFEKAKITHATGFTVQYSNDYKIIRLLNLWQGSSKSIIYVLRHNSTSINDSIVQLGKEIIIPLKSIVCNSTSHLVLLEALGLENTLKGFAQTKYIYSEKINTLVDYGQVQEVGINAKMNVEKILEINPDAVIAFNAGQENKQLTKLKKLDINVIINADYMEKSLLGRAEWLKFIALFFDKEKEANEYFNQLTTRYDSLLIITKTIDKPTVLSGIVYGDTWFMPAGKNYNAKLINDAGGQYMWQDDSGVGWLNLDFEVVYDKAAKVDYWIGVADFKSLADLKNADARYADFDAFKKGNVYTYTARVNVAGANDYFESGNINPDLILADHIKILHSELLPDYELTYYRKLK